MIAYAALGGAIGAGLRAGLGLVVPFPFGTLAVNVLGCLVMGAVFVMLDGHPRAGVLNPVVMTGVLGGFTTFSAFSLDVVKLAEAGRALAAAGYVAATLVLTLAAVALGVALARGALQ